MLELGEALVKQGVEVHVITGQLKGAHKTETVRRIKVHRIPAQVVKIAGLYPPPLVVCPDFLKYLRAIDEKEKFDLFHLHGRWFPDFTLVRKHCEETNKPLVLTVHNARPNGISPAYTLFGSAYELAIGKAVLKSADELIAVSKWTRDDVAKYKIPKNRFTVIYNAINANEFSTKHSFNVKKKLGMKPGDPLLVWVGRVIEQKGLKYLLQSLPAVLKTFPTAKLLIIGTGTSVKKLQKQAKKLGISNAIVFYGAENNRKKLNKLLNGCDLFVFPSIWEPFGLVIIEAMASGLPVVATRTGGIPEIVNSKNGWLIPSRNSKALAIAIAAALKRKDLLRKIGLNGRKIVEKKFNWRKAAQETIGVYQKALAKGHKKKSTLKELLKIGRELKTPRDAITAIKRLKKMWQNN